MNVQLNHTRARKCGRVTAPWRTYPSFCGKRSPDYSITGEKFLHTSGTARPRCRHVGR
jgi:hypothetical protein